MAPQAMQLGMVGLGRMGSNMVRRLLAAGHHCVVFDVHAQAAEPLVGQGAMASVTLADLVAKLQKPRTVWIMVPASVVDPTLAELTPLLSPGDTVIDGGNSYFHDDIRRAQELRQKKIDYLDVGTSGGVWGLERGYCQMIGGDKAAVQRLDPIFLALAPGRGSASTTPGRENQSGPPEHGYIHCGPSGAGHFVKMVHNGIEYGIMAAYAEGLNILSHANVGAGAGAGSGAGAGAGKPAPPDAETAPLRHPEYYQYDLNLPDIVETWRRGSVIASWLLDLTSAALAKNPGLEGFAGRVSDSGEGRWTLKAAIDEGVPAPVLNIALAERFSSRGAQDFANKVLSAMRFQFGGHQEKTE